MTVKERQQLSEALKPYRGQWVALRGTTVVAHAPTYSQLERRHTPVAGERRLAVPPHRSEPYVRL